MSDSFPSCWSTSYMSKLGKLTYRSESVHTVSWFIRDSKYDSPKGVFAQGLKSSNSPGWLVGDDDSSPCPSMLSNMGVRADRGDADLIIESGGEPEMKATRLSRSVARRLDCGLARAFLLAFDVVMDGSVAEARKSRGRLLLFLGDDSLLCIWERRISEDGEAMVRPVVARVVYVSLIRRLRRDRWPRERCQVGWQELA